MLAEAERLEAEIKTLERKLDDVVTQAAVRQGEARIAEARGGGGGGVNGSFSSPRAAAFAFGTSRDLDVRAERMQPSLHLESGTRRRKGTETPVLQPLASSYV
jgi:hypothetical protein